MKIIKILAIVLVFVLAFAACTSKPAEPAQPTEPPAEETTEPVAPEEKPEETAPADAQSSEPYTGVELVSAILERKAILSGTPFKVKYVIKNNGDKTISYVHGSGTAVVPSALVIVAPNELQPVAPKEEIGPMTMDYQTNILEPGQSIELDYTFLAINQIPDFNEKAFEFQKEKGEYIGDKNVEELKTFIEGITPSAPGSYTIESQFIYDVLEDPQDLASASSTQNTATSSLQVGIS